MNESALFHDLPNVRRAGVLNDVGFGSAAAVPGVVKSISDDEDEILLGIMRLHNGGRPFAVDATYSVGGLYRRNVPSPLRRFDIAPQSSDVEQADARSLPLEPESVDSVVFDPPFMFNPHGTALTHNAANRRYTMFSDFAELESVYTGALAEFKRVLRPKGIVAFKCQDYTDSKTTMTHCHVWQWATGLGFYAKDLFVRYRMHGPAYNPHLKQKHARKFHSYWWVFERARS